jgi:hypothetical protein
MTREVAITLGDQIETLPSLLLFDEHLHLPRARRPDAKARTLSIGLRANW